MLFKQQFSCFNANLKKLDIFKDIMESFITILREKKRFSRNVAVEKNIAL